jgi:lipopolysaccharide export system permease protein
LRIFLLALGAFVGIYLLVDFFERVDDFIEHKASGSLYFLYFINKIPLIVTQVAPLAVLLGVFMTLGGLSRTNELTAMRAGGISLVRITFPLLGISLLTALAVLATNEFVVPLSVKKTNHIFRTEVRGKEALSHIQDRVWFREGNRIINIRVANPDQATLEVISIFEIDKEFRLLKRVDAARAVFGEDGWLFENKTMREFDPSKPDIVRVERGSTGLFELAKKPEDFQTVSGDSEEFGFSQLRFLAGKLKAEGYDATRYLVDMHSRLATPFACVIMAFLGIPFALRKGRGASLATGVTLSVAIGITYFILQAVLTAFGYSSVIPPLVAAWAANLLFLLLGIWLMLYARD